MSSIREYIRAHISIDNFRDGALILTIGDKGMSTDLLFAEGACAGDPLLSFQLDILEEIVRAVKESGVNAE